MNNSGDYLCTLDESDRFAGSMASCIAHFSTVFLKWALKSPKPESKLPRFPLLYNYRPVTIDKGKTNTVSSMLRFEGDEGPLIITFNFEAIISINALSFLRTWSSY
jgi:hypothetical protein